MMTQYDIEMCVADVMREDDIENIESIVASLNYGSDLSWRVARGQAFTEVEVRQALAHLMDLGLVTPAVEQGPRHECSPVQQSQVGTRYAWPDVWFHLEPRGHEAVERWWDNEGKRKYPTAG